MKTHMKMNWIEGSSNTLDDFKDMDRISNANSDIENISNMVVGKTNPYRK